MSYFTPSVIEGRNHEEVSRQAEEFKSAVTKKDADSIAKKNGVRYSELIRLPYYDAVRMTSVDPMHTFLLGMVKKEVKFILEGMIPRSKKEFMKRVKSIRLPHDIGRLPTNIFDDDEYEFSGVTAQQWKNFIVSFARPCFYKLIPDQKYKSVVLLSQIVTLIILWMTSVLSISSFINYSAEYTVNGL